MNAPVPIYPGSAETQAGKPASDGKARDAFTPGTASITRSVNGWQITGSSEGPNGGLRELAWEEAVVSLYDL